MTNPTENGVQGSEGGAQTETDEKPIDPKIYEKFMGEIKGLRDRLKTATKELDTFKSEKEQIELNKKLENDKHLEVISDLQEKVNALTGQVSQSQQEKDDIFKLSSVINQLNAEGINLDDKYFGLLPLDKIEMQDGMVSKESLTKAVQDFKSEHPILVAPKRPLPDDTKPSGDGKISMADAAKLSFLERRKAMQDGKIDFSK